MFFSKLHLFKSDSPKNCGIKQYKNGCPGQFSNFFNQNGDPDFGIHLLQTKWYSKIGILLYYNVRNFRFDEIMEEMWFCFLVISGTLPIKVIVIRISNSTWSFYCLPRCQKIHGKICLSTYKAHFRLLWRWLR